MVSRQHRPTAIPVSPLLPTPAVEFSADNSRVRAFLPTGESVEVLLYGATVISWKTSAGQEQLWLSEGAKLDGSKAVRGGIPVVFPIFGPPPPGVSLAQHGFARTSRWEFFDKSTSESEGTGAGAGKGSAGGDSSVKLDFGLSSTNLPPEVRKAWPYSFGLIYSVTLGRDWLETTMAVRNEGEESFEFQLLLHSYLFTKDISSVGVQGLQGAEYVDKVAGGKKAQEQAKTVGIQGEVDRVYSTPAPTASGTEPPVITLLENGKPKFEIRRDNLEDLVVWNPAAEKAAALADFAPKDGWENLICLEAGAVAGLQKLEAGDTFEGGQIIRISE